MRIHIWCQGDDGPLSGLRVVETEWPVLPETGSSIVVFFGFCAVPIMNVVHCMEPRMICVEIPPDTTGVYREEMVRRNEAQQAHMRAKAF